MRNSNKILIYLLLVLFLTGFSLEFSFGLIPYGLFLLIGLTLLSGGLTLVIRLSKGQSRGISIPKIIFFTSLCSLIFFFVIGRIQTKITRDSANLIIEKLDDYKYNFGRYPDRLDDLTPNYFRSVPKVRIGVFSDNFIYDFRLEPNHKFRYFKAINDLDDYNFWLGYYGYIGTESFYNSKEKIWKTDD